MYTNSNTYAATTIQTEAANEEEIETAVVISDIDKSTPIPVDSISKPLDTAIETIPQISIKEKEQSQKEVITSIAINCVVVVAVFKEENNKTAVIDKLKSLGHSYTEGKLSTNRSYLGVPVACDNEQERQKLLSELNQDFGIDTWVMRLKLQ